MSSSRSWLEPEDVKLVSDLPTAAGGSANIYEATHDGPKVVLKSHRCYISFDVAQTVAVHCNRNLCRTFR